MKAYGNGTMRRFRPLVTAVLRADRSACWHVFSAEHRWGRLPG